MRLPLFPLHAVLFPGATLPLHVFEPRYRELVGRCLEHDEPFGVVLILEGEEVGGRAIPRRIGTEAAIIASWRYSDGRYDIVVEGRRRFMIQALDKARAYLRADVEILADRPGHETDVLADAVARLSEGLVHALETSGRPVVDETWKDIDAQTLSYRIAAALPAADEVRQELLELPDAASRLRREAELLMSIHRIGTDSNAA